MQSTPTVNPNRTSFYIQHGVGPACHTHSCVFLLPSSSVSHAAHHAPLLRRPTRLPLWSTTPVGHPSRAQAGRPYRVAPSRPLRSTALPILLLATLPALWLAPRSHASVNLDHRHRFGPPPHRRQFASPLPLICPTATLASPLCRTRAQARAQGMSGGSGA
jgi:hypothetical protein